MCEDKDNIHNHRKTINQNYTLFKIIIAVIFFLLGIFSNVENFAKFIIFLLAYLIAGYDVVFTAIKNILKGEIFDENFLMSIATIGAFGIQEYPEAVMVMILYQLGEHLQERAVEKSRKSITDLMDIKPDYANIEKNGKLEKISPEKVKIGEIFVVQAGEKIPLDGTIIEGSSNIDTSALTGESIPTPVKIGDNVLSGSINFNGLIKVKAEKEFNASTVCKILELVENAKNKKSKSEKYITKFAKIYTPIVCLFAAIIAIIPPILTNNDFSIWIQRALTFLVISCPCALVISVPLSFFAGIGKAAKKGILIKGSKYIETLSKVGTIVFDKTGTITHGSFEVTEIIPQNGYNKQDVINTAALAEAHSNHPIAISIKKAASKEPELSLIQSTNEITGKGIITLTNTGEILVGTEQLMQDNNVNYSHSNTLGKTSILVALNKNFIGEIIISDKIKNNTKAAINSLKKHKIKLIMLSGDNLPTVKMTAETLNINKYYANLLPHQKVEKIEEIMRQNKSKTIFVGDGINDAPVLSRADIGIAMGAIGSDAAIEAADIVIMDDKISKIPLAIKIADKTISISNQNIALAISIKFLFLILGGFGLITMWGAVFADTGVCLVAILNSLRALK